MSTKHRRGVSVTEVRALCSRAGKNIINSLKLIIKNTLKIGTTVLVVLIYLGTLSTTNQVGTADKIQLVIRNH